MDYKLIKGDLGRKLAYASIESLQACKHLPISRVITNQLWLAVKYSRSSAQSSSTGGAWDTNMPMTMAAHSLTKLNRFTWLWVA